jgi:hypothetical protein
MQGSQVRQWTTRVKAALVAGALIASTYGASAQEFVYGSWVPASDYLNSNALPFAFKQIDEET